MRVYLTGFSASGKTTVGAILARKLRCRFIDTDRMIENQADMSIPEIFRRKGEAAFRALEEKALSKVLRRPEKNLVVAVGGGVPANASMRRLIEADGRVIYLSCSARELCRRLRGMTDRPMLEVKARQGETVTQARQRRIRQLLDLRKPAYRRADIKVSTTDRPPRQVAEEILCALRRNGAGD